MGTGQAEQHVDGRRLRWEAHKKERRRLIIDAALEVIEEHPPGAEIHIHQIAERAGMARPAIYRHFADRADLDRAVQARAIQVALAELQPDKMLRGTLREVIDRILRTYIHWAGEHASLHRVATRERSGSDGSPLRAAVLSVVEVIRPLIRVGADAVGATLDDADRESLDLLVYALVSEAVGAVRLWLSRPERRPSADDLSSRAAEVLWYQIDGLARARGVTLDPDMPIEEIVAAALSGTTSR